MDLNAWPELRTTDLIKLLKGQMREQNGDPRKGNAHRWAPGLPAAGLGLAQGGLVTSLTLSPRRAAVPFLPGVEEGGVQQRRKQQGPVWPQLLRMGRKVHFGRWGR